MQDCSRTVIRENAAYVLISWAPVSLSSGQTERFCPVGIVPHQAMLFQKCLQIFTMACSGIFPGILVKLTQRQSCSVQSSGVDITGIHPSYRRFSSVIATSMNFILKHYRHLKKQSCLDLSYEVPYLTHSYSKCVHRTHKIPVCTWLQRVTQDWSPNS